MTSLEDMRREAMNYVRLRNKVDKEKWLLGILDILWRASSCSTVVKCGSFLRWKKLRILKSALAFRIRQYDNETNPTITNLERNINSYKLKYSLIIEAFEGSD
jgi:hypothetical protein